MFVSLVGGDAWWPPPCILVHAARRISLLLPGLAAGRRPSFHGGSGQARRRRRRSTRSPAHARTAPIPRPAVLQATSYARAFNHEFDPCRLLRAPLDFCTMVFGCDGEKIW